MKTCDACEERWEDSFFCERCSSGGELVWREVPNPMWDGYPGEEMVMAEEWEPHGDICLNCCGCHLAKDQFKDSIREELRQQVSRDIKNMMPEISIECEDFVEVIMVSPGKFVAISHRPNGRDDRSSGEDKAK